MQGSSSAQGSIGWRPDPQSTVPIYRQLVHHLRNQIHAGALPFGTQLPPQRLLANCLGVNRSTVVAAYQELQADGLVHGHAGGGTLVRAPDPDDAATGTLYDWHDILDRGSFIHDRSLAAEVAHARTLLHVVPLAQGELAPELRPRLSCKISLR